MQVCFSLLAGGDEYAGAVEYINISAVGVVSGLGVSFGFGLEVAKKVRGIYCAILRFNFFVVLFHILGSGVLGGVLGLLAGVSEIGDTVGFVAQGNASPVSFL